MVDQLKKRLSALRKIAPELNAVADEANQIVKAVEKSLVEEMHLGISARSRFFSRHLQPVTDHDNDRIGEEEVNRCLAFDRVSGDFCIHVLEVVFREGEQPGYFTEEIDSTPILWSSCDRELRLTAFQELPDLLDRILDRATSLLETTRATAQAVRQMTADDQS